MKSIQIVDKTKTTIDPCIIDRSQDPTLLLYQKILVLMLSLNKEPFRSEEGTDLVQLLQGANVPDTSFLLHLGQTACTLVMDQLDPEDRLLITLLRALVLNGSLYIILHTDEEQIRGILA